MASWAKPGMKYVCVDSGNLRSGDHQNHKALMITIETKHIPPSVNALYRNAPGKGRVKTERYKVWENAAGWSFNGKGSIPGPYKFRMIVSRANTRKNRDLDSFIKAPMDLLQKRGIIENDNLCQSIRVDYGDCEGIYIEVEPA